MELLDHTRTIDQIITAGRHDIHTSDLLPTYYREAV
jgi:hypothetical protein